MAHAIQQAILSNSTSASMPYFQYECDGIEIIIAIDDGKYPGEFNPVTFACPECGLMVKCAIIDRRGLLMRSVELNVQPVIEMALQVVDSVREWNAIIDEATSLSGKAYGLGVGGTEVARRIYRAVKRRKMDHQA